MASDLSGESMSSLPWDDPRWREDDTPWAAGCRWLQAWWRAEVLDLRPGALSGNRRDRLVDSMIPLGSDRGANFLGSQILEALDARLREGKQSGIIAEDRLFRNLLSSQPACFNLFGLFVAQPAPLLSWISSIDDEATAVREVRFEWAPPKAEHFGGGSAFDAFIEYSAGSRNRFLGVECKYAEDLTDSKIKVRQPYIEFTTAAYGWHEGAAARLNVPSLKQFWLNTLLAQSLVERSDGYDRGTVVVVACARDLAALDATDRVRAELTNPDSYLRWSPYEEILATIDDPDHADWAEQFRTRYLDFTPVAHLLAPDDPRRLGEEESGSDFSIVWSPRDDGGFDVFYETEGAEDSQ